MPTFGLPCKSFAGGNIHPVWGAWIQLADHERGAGGADAGQEFAAIGGYLPFAALAGYRAIFLLLNIKSNMCHRSQSLLYKAQAKTRDEPRTPHPRLSTNTRKAERIAESLQLGLFFHLGPAGKPDTPAAGLARAARL